MKKHLKNKSRNLQVVKTAILGLMLSVLIGCQQTTTQTNGNANVTPSANSNSAANVKVAPSANSNSSVNADNARKADEQSSTGETVVTHDGFGKIKIGMTVAQASQALGAELVAPHGKGEECYYVEPKQGFKGVDFMVNEGKIARIDVANKEYATDKGAKIGDTEARIKSLYPGIESFPQKYDEKKNDLEIYSPDKKYLIVFETDGKVVTGFRAGRAEEAGWVERCG